MNNLILKEIKTPHAWNQYVMGHGNSGFCHVFAWTKVIEVYHHTPVYLAAVKERPGHQDRIHGILPLFRFKDMTRLKYISIPFFDTAGILAQDRETESFLLRQSHDLLKKNGISGLEIRQDEPLDTDIFEMTNLFPEIYRKKVGLGLDLKGSQQIMMKSFKSKLRSQINKGYKNDLTWKIGKKELLPQFYKVFSRNMRDLGSPVHSKAFFNAALTHFIHQAFICVVFYRSQPVAASFMFRFKKTLSNPWASSLKEFRHLNTNMFLYWQMIRFACNLGLDVFDMGRSSKGAPAYRFKKQWGPKEKQLFWYHWKSPGKNRSKRPESLTIEPWKKLPLHVSRLIGPLIRRRISL